MRVLVLAAVSFIAYRWVLFPIRTDGISMDPTYGPNTLHFVNRLSYVFSTPSRGDVVAIRLAGPSLVYVKRVVGLPRERLSIVAGVVHVNGVPLDEPYVRSRRPWEVPEKTIGPHEFFAVGDNRGMLARDHQFGIVDEARILGKVVF